MGLLDQLQNRVSKSKKRAALNAVSKKSVFELLGDIKVEGYPHNLSDDRFIDRLSVEANVIRLNFLIDNQFDHLKDKIRVEVIKALGSLEKIAGLQVQVRSLKNEPKPLVKSPLAQIKNIIAIASGKGGVGKSSCAVNLAYALKQTGARVGLLDADVYGPSLVKMTGVKMPEEMIGDRVVPPVKDGIKIISAAMFQSSESSAAVMRGPMATQIINQFLKNVEWGELDVLVVDFPPGTGDVQITLAQEAQITGAVIITTPQDVALLDARKAISMFKTVNIPIMGVIENMSYFQCDEHEKRHYIFGQGGGKRLAEEYNVPLIAEIPIDETIPLASDTGKAVVKILPESKSTIEFSKAAFEIAKATVNEKKFKPFAFAWERRD